MAKRISILPLSFFALLMVLCLSPLPVMKVHAQTEHSNQEILDLTGILHNEQGQSLMKHKYVTRAEFASILMQVLSAGEAETGTTVKLFSDVALNHPNAVDIQRAVSGSYLSGYHDGTFRPEKAITGKEAAVALLALLGYTREDFTGQVTTAVMTKFNTLGLNRNLKLAADSKLSQQSCQILFANLLCAKQKTGDPFGKTLGYTYTGDNQLDFDALFLLKLKTPLLMKDDWTKELSHKLSEYTIYQDNVKATSTSLKSDGIAYYNDKSRVIYAYSGMVSGLVDNVNYSQGAPQDITISGVNYLCDSNDQLKKQFKTNQIQKNSMVVLFLGRSGNVSYVLPIHSVIADASLERNVGFSLASASIYVNNRLAKAQDITNQDVVYYSSELETLWVFHEQILGTYEGVNATPGEMSSITVSGIEYYPQNSKVSWNQWKAASLTAKAPVILRLGWNHMIYDILPLTTVIANDDWTSRLGFPLNQSVIYRSGCSIQPEEIHTNDVIYYNKTLKKLWVYDTKVSGTLKAVTPSITAPSSVQIGNQTYSLEQAPIMTGPASLTDPLTLSTWGSLFKANGLSLQTPVVALFGYNNALVSILPMNQMPVAYVGYLYKIEQQVTSAPNQASGIKSMITLLDTSGSMHTFPSTNNQLRVGMITEVSFVNGQPEYRILSASSGFTLPADITARKVSLDARILVLRGSNYTSIPAQVLPEFTWNTSNVLYCSFDTEGKITDLILKDILYPFYQYGIFQGISDGHYEETGSLDLSFLFGSSTQIFSTNAILWNTALVPKAVYIENNNVVEMHNLTAVKLSYINQLQANTGSSVVNLADDVSVYFYKNGIYYPGTLEDIQSFKNVTVTGYQNNQGPIRIIIVTE